VIHHVAHGGPGWSWVQGHETNRNGRAAYLAMKGHYLGKSYQSYIHSQADATLETAFYDGQKRNFTFERYLELIKRAFEDIKKLGETVEELRRVRVLLRGITDKRLDTAVNAVIGSDELSATFEAAANHIKKFITTKGTYDGGPHRSISAIGGGGRGGRG